MDKAASFITLVLAVTLLFMYVTGRLEEWFGGVM
jgi:hypothetical protein